MGTFRLVVGSSRGFGHHGDANGGGGVEVVVSRRELAMELGGIAVEGR